MRPSRSRLERGNGVERRVSVRHPNSSRRCGSTSSSPLPSRRLVEDAVPCSRRRRRVMASTIAHARSYCSSRAGRIPFLEKSPDAFVPAGSRSPVRMTSLARYRGPGPGRGAERTACLNGWVNGARVLCGRRSVRHCAALGCRTLQDRPFAELARPLFRARWDATPSFPYGMKWPYRDTMVPTEGPP